MKWYVPLAHLRPWRIPWHSRESDYIKKLCEQLSTKPSNDPTTVNWLQIVVKVRLGEG